MKNQGIGIVQVMLLASIAAGMAVVLLNLGKDQGTVVKNRAQRLEIEAVSNNIEAILSHSDSCQSTFGELEMKTSDKSNGFPIEEIVRYFPDADEEESEFVAYATSTQKDPISYGQGLVEISSMRLIVGPGKLKKLERGIYGDYTLIVQFDLGKGRPLVKRIPLEVYVEVDQKGPFISYCKSKAPLVPSERKAKLVFLDISESAISGKTGHEACATRGLSCSWVQSDAILELNQAQRTIPWGNCIDDNSKEAKFIGNVFGCDQKISNKKSTINGVGICHVAYSVVCS